MRSSLFWDITRRVLIINCHTMLRNIPEERRSAYFSLLEFSYRTNCFRRQPSWFCIVVKIRLLQAVNLLNYRPIGVPKICFRWYHHAYSPGGARFEYQPGHRQNWQMFFVVLLGPPSEMYVTLGKNYFPPHRVHLTLNCHQYLTVYIASWQHRCWIIHRVY